MELIENGNDVALNAALVAAGAEALRSAAHQSLDTRLSDAVRSDLRDLRLGWRTPTDVINPTRTEAMNLWRSQSHLNQDVDAKWGKASVDNKFLHANQVRMNERNLTQGAPLQIRDIQAEKMWKDLGHYSDDWENLMQKQALAHSRNGLLNLAKTATIGSINAVMGWGVDRWGADLLGIERKPYTPIQFMLDAALTPQIARMELPFRFKYPLMVATFASSRILGRLTSSDSE